ncbi:MAG TPA: DUF3618 domain-containing protein [Pyrinomonadaceae bacterium]|jgi:ElaB/YqjD/DUF883 family membrane-anchored ribosome-binding protein
MAEEPGKLSRISDDDENTDAVSTAAGATDTYSTGRLGDYPASDTETRELDANATDEETTEDTEQIRAQIEETRSQMSETIDAIQEKLSMSNIKEQVSDQINSAVDTAKDAVYDATIGKAGKFMQNVGRSLSDVTGSVGRGLSDVTGNVGNALADTGILETVRRNPLPFALIGLGVGMLALQSRRRTTATLSSPSYSYDYDAGNYNEGDYDYEGDTGHRTGRGRSTRSTLKSATRTVGGAASTAVGGVSTAASTAYSGVSTAASTAYQGLASAADSAYDGIGTVGTQARQIAGTAQDQYEYYLEENPLAVGAVALAVGAAVGFMIPATQTEGELMGEYRDSLVEKAGDVARGALDKVQQVAGEVSRTVQEQAGSQDLVQ